MDWRLRVRPHLAAKSRGSGHIDRPRKFPRYSRKLTGASQLRELLQDLCPAHRSEEHTSELQSHSFISYAVFCLKNKLVGTSVWALLVLPRCLRCGRRWWSG